MSEQLSETPEPIPPQPGWQPPEPEALARLLPQYRIESLIGCGGMAAVYRGTQVSLDRPIAIKLLPSEVAADAQFVERFRREACILANLKHPGIVTVYESGQTTEGHLFFVMEFVDGTDLHQILSNSGVNPKQALAFISQICDALEYAHKQGVIHSDIKPGNILISRDGCARLADFGLARPVDPARASTLPDHTVMGTPDYAAPEQHDGLADPRSDLFSLGVVLYEMLTGQKPRTPFVPPSRLVPVDVRLDDLVAKALQPDAAHRYQRVSVMKAVVDRIRTSPIQHQRTPKVRKASGNTAASFAGICIPILIAAVLYFYFGNGKDFLFRRQPSSDSMTQTTADNSEAGASNNLLTSEEAADGWTLLFNGKNLDGWMGLPGFWKVRDGTITGETTAAYPAEESTCLIWQKEKHLDFELKFQSKIQSATAGEVGSSAVLFRFPLFNPTKFKVPDSYGMLIQKHPGKTGYFFENQGAFPEVERGLKVTLKDGVGANKLEIVKTGKLDHAEEIDSAIHSEGWNNCRIVADGSRVQFFVNNYQTVDFTDERKNAPGLGQLAFQINPSAGTTVQFRNVKLRKHERAPVEDPAVQEAARKRAELLEAERIATEKKETEAKEAEAKRIAMQEAALKEAERIAAEKKAAEMREAERKEAQRSAMAKIVAEKKAALLIPKVPYERIAGRWQLDNQPIVIFINGAVEDPEGNRKGIWKNEDARATRFRYEFIWGNNGSKDILYWDQKNELQRGRKAVGVRLP